MAEICDSKQRGAPVGNGAEVVYEPSQRRLRLAERTRRHHEAAERNLAAEIQWRRNEYGSHYRDPAKAGGDPGEIGVTPDDAARRSEHIAKMKLDPALLIRLTLRQRNVIDVLVDSHQRKAQIGLARVAFRVAGDETSTDPVVETENEVVRQNPEHARESKEQYQGLEQSDAEIGRQLAELARVFMDALVRVDAHGSRIGKPKRAARQHPVAKEAEYEPLTQLELQGFDQPSLRHIESEEKSCDHEEDAKLEQEVPQVTPR